MANLHVHTRFSVADGMATSDELARAATGPLAITDHNTMAGVVQHQIACNKHNVKPIFGVDLDIEDGTRLTLLAENEQGYGNLIKLVSSEHTWGHVDLFSDGVIALSGDLKGGIPQAILSRNNEMLKTHYDRLSSIFGDRLYFEKIDHGLREQEIVNHHLERIGEITGTPTLETNDVHFVSPEDAHSQAVLICDRLGRSLNLERIDALREAYLKEVNCPVAREVADRCNVEVDIGADPVLPTFSTPDGTAPHEYLRRTAKEGLRDRLGGTIPEEYESRLMHEWSIICRMNYEGYYLIVADFIQEARDMGIPVGPGRGSGAGSLLAYATGITDLDPIEYDLLFERFLNPERVSMPDFDIDFGQEGRDRIISRVREKYEPECVAGISTYGALKPRSAWKSAARVFGVHPQRANRLSKEHLPEGNEGMTLEECREDGDLDDLYDEEDTFEAILGHAEKIEGCFRNVGQHAAGVVIADKPIEEYTSTLPSDGGVLDKMVELNMEDVEEVGMVKFDFLGLAELSVMRRARELSPDPIPDPIPLEDDDTFDLISSGNTLGTFQLGSEGFMGMLKKLKPTNFGHIIDAVALYRPGPKERGMVSEYIRRRHGKSEVEYPHPDLEPILSDTLGIMIYQEQVMKIAQKIAGFSLGEADILRRAMGKKKIKVMKNMKTDFLEGAQSKGYSRELADELWDLTRSFAAYGFNRSHSACYAKIAYETSYMKTHHTAAYLAAQMSVRRDDFDAVAEFIENARQMGVEVIEPDVTQSPAEFRAGTDKIWVGLKSLKGLHEETAEKVEAGGPYQDIEDFLGQILPGKADMEALCRAGALDAVCGVDSLNEACQARADVLENGQNLVEALEDYQSQVSMFSFNQAGISLDEADPLSPYDCMADEFEMIGRFRRWHPVDVAKKDRDFEPLSEWRSQNPFRALCLIESVREVVDRNGNTMAFLGISDGDTSLDVTVFSRDYRPERFDVRRPVVMYLEHNIYEGELGVIFKAMEHIDDRTDE